MSAQTVAFEQHALPGETYVFVIRPSSFTHVNFWTDDDDPDCVVTIPGPVRRAVLKQLENVKTSENYPTANHTNAAGSIDNRVEPELINQDEADPAPKEEPDDSDFDEAEDEGGDDKPDNGE